MPKRISDKLAKESSSNKLNQAIPLLADLLHQDDNVKEAFLCREDAVQIFKLRDEGQHFCAYRNMQMMLADQPRPWTVPDLQAAIERAWDKGFNSHGRIETGGIVGTRKHVGTSEAHFSEPPPTLQTDRVHITAKPPIFLQRPRHSLNIIGLEHSRNGKRSLIVFDPGYQPPSSVYQFLSRERQRPPSTRHLTAYRRNHRYLKRYSNFETLTRLDIPKGDD
ncbi:hypothetical protein ANO11243_021100 [Dothideomycetidae sp. 11243]|nr:hypothetical protein ANO11243_021100 [fungal sp. No.11243]